MAIVGKWNHNVGKYSGPNRRRYLSVVHGWRKPSIQVCQEHEVDDEEPALDIFFLVLQAF